MEHESSPYKAPKTLLERQESIDKQRQKLQEKEDKLKLEVQSLQAKWNPPTEKPVEAPPVDTNTVVEQPLPPEPQPPPPPASAFERAQLAKQAVSTRSSPIQRNSTAVRDNFLAGAGGSRFLNGESTKNRK